jgi:uncharacterized protein YndB with AHSA1/START domain
VTTVTLQADSPDPEGREMTDRPFRVEVEVGAPRDAVWRALTEAPEVRRWFGWEYEGLADEVDFIFVQAATPKPPDRIEFADGGPGQVIELDERSPLTLVRVLKEGEPPADDVYDAEIEGWWCFLHQLAHYLERHDGQERRTVHLSGRASQSALLADLERHAGEPVARPSRHVAVAHTRDGSLAVMESAAALDAAEPSDTKLTVTAYELDDEGFGELRESWEARFRALAGGEEVAAVV